ncbi:hypothetical protein D3260_08780 [Salinisphaera sp. Q1T1-3]|nr:hypothetical protein D3260_08780 [Salinisphaera sp. Q1T1-3]
MTSLENTPALALAKRLRRRLYRPIWESRFPYYSYMNRNRCVFVHIPKNGGTSIRRALGASAKGRTHLPWSVYEEANPKKFSRYFKFAFLRDPTSRLHSAYHYLCAGGNGADWDLEVAEDIAQYPDFDTFVAEGLPRRLYRDKLLLYPQTYFVCDNRGHIKVDFLGRMETFDRDARYVFSKLGLKQHIGRENTTAASTSGTTIAPATRERIAAFYADDYALIDQIDNSTARGDVN